MVDEPQKGLIFFQGKQIRRTWFNDEWWFSVVDIVGALTQTDRARKYWSDLKTKLQEEGFEVSEKIGQLKLMAEDGKLRLTDCATTKNMFRIVQSIPSPKAEPFKQWLAQVGYDRVQEIQNPELAQKRMKELYKAKGYSEDWLEKRVRGIAIRDELTDEWDKRGVKTEKEYAILTAEISKATFGMTPSEYKQFKGLKRENLRDHMNDLELIFSMLGERVSTEITREEDAQGYPQVEDAAKRGGRVAGNARKETEKELGRPIVTSKNFLSEPEKRKKKQIEDKNKQDKNRYNNQAPKDTTQTRDTNREINRDREIKINRDKEISRDNSYNNFSQKDRDNKQQNKPWDKPNQGGKISEFREAGQQGGEMGDQPKKRKRKRKKKNKNPTNFDNLDQYRLGMNKNENVSTNENKRPENVQPANKPEYVADNKPKKIDPDQVISFVSTDDDKDYDIPDSER